MIPTSYATDNKVLSETVALKGGYDWSLTSNGVWRMFGDIDRARADRELQDPDVCLSLVDGDTILAMKDEEGNWHGEE